MSIVPQLERELVQAASAQRLSRGSRFRKPGVALLVTFAAGGSVAAAATGVLRVGDHERLPRSPQSDGLRYTSDRLVVAKGRSAAVGRWEMTLAQSSLGTCLGLRILDGFDHSLGEGCGKQSTFTAATRANKRYTLIYGRADIAASSVQVTLPNGSKVTEAAHHGPGSTGSFYLVTLVPAVHTARVSQNDHRGRPIGKAIIAPLG